jgi:hypothetical protein
MHTLAGWQTLDMGNVTQSWSYYEHSKAAAARTGSVAYEAHAAAEQSFVRAETSLRVDLATALATRGERDEARDQAEQAGILAAQLGSARQDRRLRGLSASLAFG